MALSDYDSIIRLAAQRYAPEYGLDVDELANITRAHFMEENATGDNNAVGAPTKYGRAVGIPQLIPSTAKLLGVEDPTDPEQSIPGAVRLIAGNIKHYNGDVDKAISAYHGGFDEKQWGPKTQKYSEKVRAALNKLTSSGNASLPELPSKERALSVLDKTTEVQPVEQPSQLLQPTKMLATPVAYQVKHDAPSAKEDYVDDFDRELGEARSSAATQPKAIQKANDYVDDFDRELGEARTAPAKPVVPIANVTAPDTPAPVSPLIPEKQAAEQQLPTNPVDLAIETSGLNPQAKELLSNSSKALGMAFNPVPTAMNELQNYVASPQGKIAQEGMAYGLGDAPHTLGYAGMQLAGGDLAKMGAEDREVRDVMADQYKGDPNFELGRMGGQVISTAPVMGLAGKAGTALAQGVTKAAPGLAPVMDFLGGKVATNAVTDPVTGTVEKGASLGNRLLQYGASGTNAALQADPFTVLNSSASKEPIADQLKRNMPLAAMFGAAAPAVYDAGSAAGQFFKNLVNPVDKAAQKTKNVIQSLVDGPIDNLDTTEYVPGSKPTLAEAVGQQNPGVAALQRVVNEANPSPGGPLIVDALKHREAQNNVARRNYLEELTSKPEDLNQAYSTRSNEAEKLLNGSKNKPPIWKQANAKPADVQPVLTKIDEILAGPDRGNTAVKRSLSAIKDLLQNKEGVLETDPEYLYRSGIKTINQWLESNHPADELSQLAKAARPQVQAVKTALNESIKTAVPGYSKYLKAYSSSSKPIDQMEVLQGIDFLSEKSEHGHPTLQKVNNALHKIRRERNEPGWNQFKSLTDDQINKLQNIQKDLQRRSGPEKAIKTSGSPTNPLGELREKVKKALGTGEGTMANQLPGMGASIGATLLSPIPIVGAPAGAFVGEKLGKFGQKMMSKGAEKTKNNILEMLLEPGLYGKTPNREFSRSYGQSPEVNALVSATTPVAAVESNRTRKVSRTNSSR